MNAYTPLTLDFSDAAIFADGETVAQRAERLGHTLAEQEQTEIAISNALRYWGAKDETKHAVLDADEQWARLQFDTENDPIARMAMGVVWKGFAFQNVRGDVNRRRRLLADLMQEAYAAGLEAPTMADQHHVWYKRKQAEDGTWGEVLRDGIAELTQEELSRRYVMRHMEVACRRLLAKESENVRTFIADADDDASEDTTAEAVAKPVNVVASHVYAAGETEDDRLDVLLSKAEQYLPTQAQRDQLRLLVEGKLKLSQLSSTTRTQMQSICYRLVKASCR